MPTLPTRIKLCPACERLLADSYDLKKIPVSPSTASYKAEPCGFCGKKCVLMDTFEMSQRKRARE